MERKNNKRGLELLGLVFLFGIFLVSFVSAESCDLGVSLVNQDPYPAVPNDYVEVVFQISGVQNPDCEGAWFELIPSYPFSLDENDSLRILDESTWVSNYKNEWMIPYALRVDKNALDGAPEIEVHYASGAWSSGNYFSERFNITVEDSRTNFDAVIQEVSESEVSIAIANTGEYTANSVVVRIPKQENFKSTGTDGQMVGNLDAGDYTLVSFNLMATPQDGNNTLIFEIYYTDALGERRIVILNMPLKMFAGSSVTGEMVPGSKRGNGVPIDAPVDSGINWNLWIILAIVIVVGFVLYKKYPKQTKEFYNKSKQKITELFHKKKHTNNTSNAIPDWIKNAKDKEKKK